MEQAGNKKMNKRETGRLLEECACDIIKKNGYRIIERNFRAGRVGEIDIIGVEGEYVCFVEVKGRRDSTFGSPAEAVGYKKRNKIRLVSGIYISRSGLQGENIRYDVVELYYSKTSDGICVNSYNIIRNAF